MRADHTPEGTRMPRPILDLARRRWPRRAPRLPGERGSYVFVPALAARSRPDTAAARTLPSGFVDVDPLGAVVFSAAVSGGTLRRPVQPWPGRGPEEPAIALVGDVAPGASP
jgi:hypothetical protein